MARPRSAPRPSGVSTCEQIADQQCQRYDSRALNHGRDSAARFGFLLGVQRMHRCCIVSSIDCTLLRLPRRSIFTILNGAFEIAYARHRLRREAVRDSSSASLRSARPLLCAFASHPQIPSWRTAACLEDALAGLARPVHRRSMAFRARADRRP